MLQCRLCQNGFKSIEDHCRHIELKHSVTSNPSLTCGFKTCTAKVRGVEKYHRHFKEFHDVSEEGNATSTDPSLFKCAHPGCEYKAKSRSTLRSHLFWKHHQSPTSHVNPLNGAPNNTGGSATSSNTADSATIIFDSEDPVASWCNEPVHQPEITPNQQNEYTEDDLLKKLVHMNITLNTKYHVPESTLGVIIESYRGLLEENAKISEKILKAELESLGHSETVCQNVCDNVLFEPGLLKFHGVEGPMRSKHMRKVQYDRYFPYVAPTSISLQLNDKNEFCKYHVVSLHESLKSFFEDDSVYEQYSQRKSSLLTPCEDLSDICDGSVFKQNNLFLNDPSAIQLIVFQDEVEMGNALGPAAGSYKILHMAYTVANLFPWNRSKVDPIQLLLLCKEKDVAYFGIPKVLEPLIEELKELEETGIEIREHKVKGSILVLLGDNLGTHEIGGFSTGFSSGKYFCRYCEESRLEWQTRWSTAQAEESGDSSDSSDESSSEEEERVEIQESSSSEEGEQGADSSSDDDIPLAELRHKPNLKKTPLRTEKSYDECVAKLNKADSSGVLGVVAKCEFNRLKYFHIVRGSPLVLPTI